jgi:hypothetical protein
MKAIPVRKFGGPGIVELKEVSALLPAAGLVLVRCTPLWRPQFYVESW